MMEEMSWMRIEEQSLLARKKQFRYRFITLFIYGLVWIPVVLMHFTYKILNLEVPSN